MNALTILSSEIRQLDGLYSLNDLHNAAGAEKTHQPSNFLRRDETKELIEELCSSDVRSIPVKTVRGKGKEQGTYVCKELVYSYAMWISAKFSLLVIRAFDALQSSSNPLQLPATITEAQAGELATLVAERFPDGRKRPYAWGRFNNHFRLSGYKTLPASRFDEACEYIRAMPDKDAEKALPPPAKTISDTYSVESWLKYNPWIKPDVELTTDGKKRFSMTAFMVYSMDTRSATQMLINELTEKGHNVEACRIELNALKVFISNLRFHMQDIANIAQGSLDQTVMVKYSPA